MRVTPLKVQSLAAAIAWSLSSAWWISARAFFAFGWADFGNAARTFPILWNLCGIPHKFHYPDLLIMSRLWMFVLVTRVLLVEGSA